MSWRIIEITQRAKLELSLNYMVIRAEEIIKIHLSEISVVIIESTAVALTAALLVELAKRKIKVIFCDEKRNPIFENVSYYGSHDTSQKVRTQIVWKESTKMCVWTEIIKNKIMHQMEFLELLELPEHRVLDRYLSEIKLDDENNREGHAAKVYFNALFGKKFTRSEDNSINAALNYGYSIILSAFNREINAGGYITQLGISHNNIFNMFNLSCDFMEPFRILIDKIVYEMSVTKFEPKEKLQLVSVLNNQVFITQKKHYVNNAIKIYCKSVLDSLDTDDISLLKFYKNEL